ncbi:MAG: thioredoxin family protein [Abditibacteriota bacterium]|nr:thioredoxin family protein [Abditibacteriota bacterium]
MKVVKIIILVLIVVVVLGLWTLKHAGSRVNTPTGVGETVTLGPSPLDFKSLDEIVGKGKPVIIDFGANWCGPCRSFHPKLEKMSEQYKDVAFIKYVDVDKRGDIADDYPINVIPSQIFLTGDGVAYNPSAFVSSIDFQRATTTQTKVPCIYHVGALSDEEMQMILRDMGALN